MTAKKKSNPGTSKANASTESQPSNNNTHVATNGDNTALMLPIYDKYQLFDGSLITKKVGNELFLVYGIEERAFSKARCEATIHSLSNV